MRFNMTALASLSQGPPANFDKEGRLWVHRPPPGIPQPPPERRERWCRLRGNLLFLMQSPSQRSDPVEVIVLERCHVVESGDNHSALRIKFESGETDLCLEAGTASALQSWIVVLREANSESLRNRIQHLRRLLMAMTGSVQSDSPKAGGARAGPILVPELPLVEFSLACQNLASPARDRKPSSMLQVSVVNTLERSLAAYSCTEIVEGTRDPLFLTGVTFPPDYPLCEDTVLKLTVYDVRDRSAETRSFLGYASFSVGDLLKEQQLTLSLRTSDGTSAMGAVVVSRLRMGEAQDGETEQVAATDTTGQKHTVVCESPEGSVRDKDSGPLMNAAEGTSPQCSAVFRNPVCKVYSFQTTDSKWMLVREKMAECTLSFHIPKQLLKLYIQEDMTRIQELKGLGDLSPHWDNLRKEVVIHLGQAISSYQEVLTELSKMGGTFFKPSCCKAEKYLDFIPINLHTQRMQVTSPKQTETAYDIITVGAPAAHSLGFKNGGLRRQLVRFEAEKKSFSTTYQCIYFSPEDTAKARGVLASLSQLQPLIFSLADQLMQAAQQRSAESLKEALKTLCDTTERFVHALKDKLVKTALLALHAARPDYVTDCVGTNGSPPREDGPALLKRQNSVPPRVDYDEEEWDRVWTNVAKSLNCIIAMVDRLQESDNEQAVSPEPALADVITSHTPDADGWQEKIYPLVVTLKDCVMEVVDRAKKSMTFVLLQEVACSLPQGLLLRQRRDTVFSQALTALSCGFITRLNAGMQDGGFLRQLHLVGVLAQFESLLSTYSEEIGMLEDMEVGIADLHTVTFKITEAKSSDVVDLQPKVCGWRECYTVEVPLPRCMFKLLPAEVRGQLLHVYPVLFNVGINQQQTLAERFGDISLQERINQKSLENLENYYKSLSDNSPSKCLPSFQMQTNLEELLGTLSQHIASRKKKNVEILWLAGVICRRLNGIRFTSCKSAKDRTSMSVTLEQCSLLRDEHQLDSEHFSRALDCMRSSRLSRAESTHWPVPETGSIAEPKPASRHFYPVALLLVSSHLLVVWLILSLVFLLAKYQ
ncbi:type II inositol 3,4-bisphosphate 4-phosphatase-like isoform X3 [Paramormyrops kingsleyae]